MTADPFDAADEIDGGVPRADDGSAGTAAGIGVGTDLSRHVTVPPTTRCSRWSAMPLIYELEMPPKPGEVLQPPEAVRPRACLTKLANPAPSVI
jgi:hypothetical protein